MKASQDELSELHSVVAKVLKNKLSDLDDIDPRILAQAIKFLKDNNIAADINFNEDLSSIQEAVADVLKLPFDVDEAQ